MMKKSPKEYMDIINSTIENTYFNSHEELNAFLKDIGQEKYTQNLMAIGFDDIKLILEQSLTGLGISYNNLKEANVPKFGDRAKILIHIDDVAGNFPFKDFNREKVFKSVITKEDESPKEINLEEFIDNFFEQGCFSVDLLLIQMLGKQQINDDIIFSVLHIEKVCHRKRLLNKLEEDGSRYREMLIEKYGKRSQQTSRRRFNNIKTSLILETQDYSTSCQCLIF